MDNYEEHECFSCVNKRLTEQPEIPDNIKFVDIRRNKLRNLAIPEANNIEYLDASDNLINSLDTVQNLRKALVIDCSYNLLRKIPPLELENLKELYFISNDIECIENMKFPNLEIVDLANNSITQVNNIEAMKIKEIYLASNKITSVGDLTHLENLQILDLQYNDLEEFDCSCLPESVQILFLQGNPRLKKIHNLKRLKNLQTIGIKNTLLQNDESIKVHCMFTKVEVW